MENRRVLCASFVFFVVRNTGNVPSILIKERVNVNVNGSDVIDILSAARNMPFATFANSFAPLR